MGARVRLPIGVDDWDTQRRDLRSLASAIGWIGNDKEPSPLPEKTQARCWLRSRQIAPKGKAVHDEPARKAARAAAVGSVKLRYMQTRLSERGWKSLKLLSIELGKPLQGLVIEALNDMLRKHGRVPDVSGPEPDKE